MFLKHVPDSDRVRVPCETSIWTVIETRREICTMKWSTGVLQKEAARVVRSLILLVSG